MTDIPKNLLDLATEGVRFEEAHTFDHVTHVDSDHAPLVAVAALEPVLAELRRQVDDYRNQQVVRYEHACRILDSYGADRHEERIYALNFVLGLLGGESDGR